MSLDITTQGVLRGAKLVNAFDRFEVIEAIIQLSVRCTDRGWLLPIPTVSELEKLDTLELTECLLRAYHMSRAPLT